MALDRSMDQSLQSSLSEPYSADPSCALTLYAYLMRLTFERPQFIYLHLPPLVHAGTESIKSD